MRVPFILATVLLSTSAYADHARFGEPGVLVVSSDADLSIQHISLSPGDESTTTLNLVPAVDYFVSDHLSLGGGLVISYSSTSVMGMDSSITTLGIGARIGYDIAVADKLSLWPKATLTLGTISSGNTSNTGVGFTAFAPLLYHPAPHFFVGLGPEIHTDLTGDPKVTSFGLSFIVGGWI